MWNSYELDLVNYQNKCRLIRGWDDLFNKVKEHINSVSAMKLSPYYKVSAALGSTRSFQTSGIGSAAFFFFFFSRCLRRTL